MTELDKFKLFALKRFIFFRWLFAFFGIATVILIYTLIGSESLNLPILELLVFFVILIALNVAYYFIFSLLSKRANHNKINWLSYLNIGLDLLMVTSLIYLLGGPGLFNGFFFFIPIIEAVVLFNFWSPFFTALASGIILNSFLFLEQNFGLTYVSQATGAGFDDFNAQFVYLAGFSLAYLFCGILFAYNYHLVRPVKIFQAHNQPIETSPNKVKEDLDKREWVEKMNEKLELSNRELHAKDLELKLAKDQLEKLEQAKSKFISVTTHQLRTPLSAIKWTFNMMLEGQLGPINEEQKSFLSKAYESTQRMISIVNNLLNLDHIGTDQTDLSTALVEIVKLVETIAFEFENQLESKQISLIIKRPDRALPNVEVDPSQIRMVMENLIDNAIKYTPKGGQVTIKIKDDRINSVHPSLEVVVEDSGIGIPEEEQKKIFHKFFRASNAVSVEPDGTGIGLFIAKDIIERHGGTMWFESIFEKGTSFHLTLPLKYIKPEERTKDLV